MAVVWGAVVRGVGTVAGALDPIKVGAGATGGVLTTGDTTTGIV